MKTHVVVFVLLAAGSSGLMVSGAQAQNVPGPAAGGHEACRGAKADPRVASHNPTGMARYYKDGEIVASGATHRQYRCNNGKWQRLD